MNRATRRKQGDHEPVSKPLSQEKIDVLSDKITDKVGELVSPLSRSDRHVLFLSLYMGSLVSDFDGDEVAIRKIVTGEMDCALEAWKAFKTRMN